MNDHHACASLLLRVTLLVGFVVSVAVPTSGQSASNGPEQGRVIATIVDAVFTNYAGSKREDPILDAAPDATNLLQKAMLRESVQRGLSLGARTGEKGFDQQPASQRRGWIQRHPTLFGALVGAGLGAVSSIPRWNELYCATGGDEDCLFHGASGVAFGAGVGAGIGALVGHAVGK